MCLGLQPWWCACSYAAGIAASCCGVDSERVLLMGVTHEVTFKSINPGRKSLTGTLSRVTLWSCFPSEPTCCFVKY
ncbi:hypothetical protein DFJ58DRAFT_807203, partial [Suillus subalutaceus]|uniref:uncharacterized protein n=1 Tax=Suillus subalutaceus TaxID=48586 RepID=UPI001B8712EF